VLAGPTEVLPVDMVVMATGYRIANDVSEVGNGVPIPKTLDPVPDRRWQASGILANPAPPFARSQPVGVLSLGREHALVMSAFARRERIWVAGDALVGPSTVVEAMAQGKRAAQAVVHHAPRRKGGEQSPPRHVLVAVESRSGRTAAVAAELAGMLSSKGPTVKVLPMSDVGPEQLAWADALVIGTWVEGLVIAKVGPARAAKRWLRDLPPLGGMPVALLCTYAISPGSTLAAMRRAVEEHGGRVVAEAALAPRKKAERLAPALERIGMALAGRRTREEQRAVVHAAGSRHARTPGATT
jgi:flavodoxin